MSAPSTSLTRSPSINDSSSSVVRSFPFHPRLDPRSFDSAGSQGGLVADFTTISFASPIVPLRVASNLARWDSFFRLLLFNLGGYLSQQLYSLGNVDNPSAHPCTNPTVDMCRWSTKRVSTGEDFCNYGTLRIMGGIVDFAGCWPFSNFNFNFLALFDLDFLLHLVLRWNSAEKYWVL